MCVVKNSKEKGERKRERERERKREWEREWERRFVEVVCTAHSWKEKCWLVDCVHVGWQR